MYLLNYYNIPHKIHKDYVPQSNYVSKNIKQKCSFLWISIQSIKNQQKHVTVVQVPQVQVMLPALKKHEMRIPLQASQHLHSTGKLINVSGPTILQLSTVTMRRISHPNKGVLSQWNMERISCLLELQNHKK